MISATLHNMCISRYLSLLLVDFQMLWNILWREYIIEGKLFKSPPE